VADNTAIEWADTTWNPLLGCERVSDGCTACYAIRTATIRASNPHPKVAAAFEGLTERRDGRLDWTGRINLLPDRLTEPLRKRKPSKIFVNSQSDLFHKDVPDEFIAKVFAVMAAAPWHIFQLLTKRHARMRSLLSSDAFRRSVQARVPHMALDPYAHTHSKVWPLPNLWVGVSVEDQHWANIRAPALLATPAAVRWLSCEPLLGAVDLRSWLYDRDEMEGASVCQLHGLPECWQGCTTLDWVVVGGESGPGARPMRTEWARSLRDQCAAAEVPFLFKQWGAWVAPSQMPEDTFMSWDVAHGSDMCDTDRDQWRFSKKSAGRLLDGRTWDEYPRQSQLDARLLRAVASAVIAGDPVPTDLADRSLDRIEQGATR
jgi:protein gp37